MNPHEVEARAMFDIGEFVAKGLREKGWTQAEFAEKVGTQRAVVSQWVTGQTLPGDEKLKKISALLDEHEDYLVTQKWLNWLEAKGVNLSTLTDSKILWDRGTYGMPPVKRRRNSFPPRAARMFNDDKKPPKPKSK